MIVHTSDQVKRFCGIDSALIDIGFCSVTGPDIDPSLIHCNLLGSERLAFIYMRIKKALYGVNPLPVLAAIEDYSFGSIARQHALGEAGGVTKLAVQHAGVTLITVAPKQLKLFVANSGDAKKPRMIRAVNKKYGLKLAITEKNGNLADAIGLAKIAQLYAGEAESQIRAELEVIAKLRKKYGND